MNKWTIINGECLDTLRTLDAVSVQTCVTSPPYFGLRDYGVEGQIGLEPTPDEYVAKLVAVFREVRRVLRDDGTLWLNLGDSYSGGGNYRGVSSEETLTSKQSSNRGARGLSQLLGAKNTRTFRPGAWKKGEIDERGQRNRDGVGGVDGLPAKNLIGIPWRVAFALQADGWYLRQDIIWHKPNPMPESVRDRCTKAHEYIFLLSKSAKYCYDAAAIAEPSTTNDPRRPYTSNGAKELDGRSEWQSGERREGEDFSKRNKRSVWTVPPRPYKGAHFATFPPALIEPCILAGAPVGGVVLDPFMGSGTTLAVAVKHKRIGLGIELNPTYCDLARARLAAATGALTRAAAPPAVCAAFLFAVRFEETP